MKIKATYFTVMRTFSTLCATVPQGTKIRAIDMMARSTNGNWVTVPAANWVEHDVRILQFLSCDDEEMDAVVALDNGQIDRMRTHWLQVDPDFPYST